MDCNEFLILLVVILILMCVAIFMKYNTCPKDSSKCVFKGTTVSACVPKIVTDLGVCEEA
jgi:hypothetical protein